MDQLRGLAAQGLEGLLVAAEQGGHRVQPSLLRQTQQDGTVLPEELFVTESSDLGGLQFFLQGAETPEAAPEAPAQPPEPDPDAGKHAFEVFLDCIAMDDGLVQYLIDVLKRMDRAEFFKLSQITTKLDLDPEEFLYWLAQTFDLAESRSYYLCRSSGFPR